MKKLRVAELFAGVGGFRLGITKAAEDSGIEADFVFSNQWEPSSKVQHASDIYAARFGEKGHSNEDIALVGTTDIPDHDILCGGFPCQDYSVATTLRSSKGLLGKKGVLWWQIERILGDKEDKAPDIVFLENVDRLLKSPASQRGRDFAIMLASLNDLGYAVEWRVVNAADYGMPQRRRRVFILGYRAGTAMHDRITTSDPMTWQLEVGVMAQAFPAVQDVHKPVISERLEGSLDELTDDFCSIRPDLSDFRSSGVCINRAYTSFDVKPVYDGERKTLGDILQPENEVPDEFTVAVIPNLEKELAEDPSLTKFGAANPGLDRWVHEKGAKRKEKVNRDGHTYVFAEGGMSFPDPLNLPGRTIITSEGGRTPSRFKHVIRVGDRLRRLTPIELERMNMFPDDHTAGLPDTKRAFMMGNALVVGVVERIGRALIQQLMS